MKDYNQIDYMRKKFYRTRDELGDSGEYEVLDAIIDVLDWVLNDVDDGAIEAHLPS